MRFVTSSFLIIVGCYAVFGAGKGKGGVVSPWDPLLAQVKLTPQKAQLDPNRWAGGGTYRLNSFQRLWDDWRLVDGATVSAGQSMLKSCTSFYSLGVAAAQQIDLKLSPPPAVIHPRSPKGAEGLVAAISDLQTSLKKPLEPNQLQDLRAQCRGVPSAVAKGAAVVLRAIPAALAKRNQAFAKFGGEARLPLAYERAVALAVSVTEYDETLQLMADIDLQSLVEGGLVMGRAVDQAAAALRGSGKKPFSFRWETPLGIISLNGGQENSYDPAAYLLIIDTGGNDHYQAAGQTPDAGHPLSVALDLAGNDRYETKDTGAFGAGITGYGFLMDLEGNDTYKTERAGLGVGAFGVGMLMDCKGNDAYESRVFGQGAASFGLGVLSDWQGDDQYRCFIQAQGYGATRACGTLVDREGKDLYEANDVQIDNPSPQTKDHNTSLAQGCGFGLRADGSNSLAGGVGILAEGKGDDRYSCGVFGQGISYWYSTGMLVDMAGNDSYQGVWYCQGSSAHYGVAALCDLQGRDRYVATMAQSQGAGHDYSIGFLHDVKGDDFYQGAGSCFGLGIWNGIGIFWDEKGDDEYKTPGSSFGAYGDSRPGSSCLGLFLDGGGVNRFPQGSLPKPHSLWSQPENKDRPLSYGVGMSQ